MRPHQLWLAALWSLISLSLAEDILRKQGFKQAEDRSFYQDGWIPMTAPCPTCRKRDTSQETQSYALPLTDFHHPPPPPIPHTLHELVQQEFNNKQQHRPPLHDGEASRQNFHVQQKTPKSFSSPDNANIANFEHPQLSHSSVPPSHAPQFITQGNHNPVQQFPEISTLRTHDMINHHMIKMTDGDPDVNKEVQLLYVPVETLKERYPNSERNKGHKQVYNLAQSTTVRNPIPYTTDHQETTLRHQSYDSRFTRPDHGESTENQPLPKLKAHTPPLSVFMDSASDEKVKISDVVKLLKDARSISVLDVVGPDSPNVFIGPSNLNTPGYTKFELPYLSSIESNRVERKINRLPFFVAPLNFKPPQGYSKIPLPAPHVGSVVVSQETSQQISETQENKSQTLHPNPYNLPANLLPISPELPSLVNSLQDTNQDDVLLVPDKQQPKLEQLPHVFSTSTRPFSTTPIQQSQPTLHPEHHIDSSEKHLASHIPANRIRNINQLSKNQINNQYSQNNALHHSAVTKSSTQTQSEVPSKNIKASEHYLFQNSRPLHKIKTSTEFIQHSNIPSETATEILHSDRNHANIPNHQFAHIRAKEIHSQVYQEAAQQTEQPSDYLSLDVQSETVSPFSQSTGTSHFLQVNDKTSNTNKHQVSFFTNTENHNSQVHPTYIHNNDERTAQQIPVTTIQPNPTVVVNDIGHNPYHIETTTDNTQQSKHHSTFSDSHQLDIYSQETGTEKAPDSLTNIEDPLQSSQKINQQQQTQTSTDPEISELLTTTVTPSTVFPNRRQKHRGRTRSTTAAPSIQSTTSFKRTNNRSRRPAQTRTRVQDKERIPTHRGKTTTDKTQEQVKYRSTTEVFPLYDQTNVPVANINQLGYPFNSTSNTLQVPVLDHEVRYVPHQQSSSDTTTHQPSFIPNGYTVKYNIPVQQTVPLESTTTRHHRFRGRSNLRASERMSSTAPVTFSDSYFTTTPVVTDYIPHAHRSSSVTSKIYPQETESPSLSNFHAPQFISEHPLESPIRGDFENTRANFTAAIRQPLTPYQPEGNFGHDQFYVPNQDRLVTYNQDKLRLLQVQREVTPVQDQTTLLPHDLQNTFHPNQYPTLHQNQQPITETSSYKHFRHGQHHQPTVYQPSQQTGYPQDQEAITHTQPVFSQTRQKIYHQLHEGQEIPLQYNKAGIINGLEKEVTPVVATNTETTSVTQGFYHVKQTPPQTTDRFSYDNNHQNPYLVPTEKINSEVQNQNTGNFISSGRNAVNYTQEQLEVSNKQSIPATQAHNQQFVTNAEYHNRVNHYQQPLQVTSPATVVNLPSPDVSVTRKPIAHIDVTTFRALVSPITTQGIQTRQRTRTRNRHRDSQNKIHDQSREANIHQHVRNNDVTSDNFVPSSEKTVADLSATHVSQASGGGGDLASRYINHLYSASQYQTTPEQVRREPVTEIPIRKRQRTQNHIGGREMTTTPATRQANTVTTTDSNNKVYTIRPTKRPPHLQTKLQSTRGRIRKPTSTTTTSSTPHSATSEVTTFPSIQVKQRPINNFHSVTQNKIPIFHNIEGSSEISEEISNQGIISSSHATNYAEANNSPDGGDFYQERPSPIYNHRDFAQRFEVSSPVYVSNYNQQQVHTQSTQPLIYHHDSTVDQTVQESKWFVKVGDSTEKLNSTGVKSEEQSLEYSGEDVSSEVRSQTNFDMSMESSSKMSASSESYEDEKHTTPLLVYETQTNKNNVTDKYIFILNGTSKAGNVKKASEKKNGSGRRRGNWVRVAVKPLHRDVLETAESQNVATFSKNALSHAPSKATSSIYTPRATTYPNILEKETPEYKTTEVPPDENSFNTTVTLQPTKYPNHRYDITEDNASATKEKNEKKYTEPVDFWNMSNYSKSQTYSYDTTTDKNPSVIDEAQVGTTTEFLTDYLHTTEAPATTISYNPSTSREVSGTPPVAEVKDDTSSGMDGDGDGKERNWNSERTLEKKQTDSPYEVTTNRRNDDQMSNENLQETNDLKSTEPAKRIETSAKPTEESSSEDSYKNTVYSDDETSSKEKQTQSQEIHNNSTTDDISESSDIQPVMSAEMQEIMAKIANFESHESTVPPIDFDIQKLKVVQKSPTNEIQPHILGTSTSTEISHETEICYRGRCVKSKSNKSGEIPVQ